MSSCPLNYRVHIQDAQFVLTILFRFYIVVPGWIVDVVEVLMKFTLLNRDNKDCLLGRYSERKERAAELSKRVNQKSI
ncbi:hypothetical protein LCGC14_2165430 [marine sediment metagenome]|uniref:Uncharacterized protein n=1 Tax=marine sediment metagenome TaxID=412755 RepID=A0A0F9GMQ8_9ZZZZ